MKRVAFLLVAVATVAAVAPRVPRCVLFHAWFVRWRGIVCSLQLGEIWEHSDLRTAKPLELAACPRGIRGASLQPERGLAGVLSCFDFGLAQTHRLSQRLDSISCGCISLAVLHVGGLGSFELGTKIAVAYHSDPYGVVSANETSQPVARTCFFGRGFAVTDACRLSRTLRRSSEPAGHNGTRYCLEPTISTDNSIVAKFFRANA